MIHSKATVARLRPSATTEVARKQAQWKVLKQVLKILERIKERVSCVRYVSKYASYVTKAIWV